MVSGKKADMTINIIIAAAIAMVVMVVMIFVFIRPFEPRECPGEWTAPSECGKDGVLNSVCIITSPFFKEAPVGKVCCDTTRKNGECRP